MSTIEDFEALVEAHLEQGSNAGDMVRDIRFESGGVFGLREADHCYERCLERLVKKGNAKAKEKLDYRIACRAAPITEICPTCGSLSECPCE